MQFEYTLPINLIFGRGKLGVLGQEAAKYGKSALIVTGKGSTKRTGLRERAVRILESQGVRCTVYDQVSSNPVTTMVYQGVSVAHANGCDVIVALGGGSIIDCAKAIAYGFYNEGELFDYIYGVKKGECALPVVAVPTTCGTGSEGNGFAVLTHPETGDKKSLRYNACIPKVSIVDPELMLTMPDTVAASVMFDALCHHIEAYLSKNRQPVVEAWALYSIRLLAKYMTVACQDRTHDEAWDNVTLASTLGGINIHLAGVTAVHGMEHPASGRRDIIHGRGLAALAPSIYKRTIGDAPEKFTVLSKILGGTSSEDFVQQLDKLIRALQLETTLSKEGVVESDIDWMVENCFKVSQASMELHPKVFTKEEVKAIYYEAL